MIHELKTVNPYFKEVVSGVKTFEVRKYDRPYHIGDVLHLHEYDQNQKIYSGEQCRVRVTYILSGGQFGLELDYVVMGIEPFLTLGV